MKINGERAHERKSRMRAEAEARQAKRNERTIAEQLKLLDGRMGNSSRERSRLLRLLSQKSEAEPKAEPVTEVLQNTEEPQKPRVHMKAKDVRRKNKKEK